MLEITKALLETKEAPAVITLLMQSGLSSLEATRLVCEALATPSKVKMQKIVILWSEGLAEENLEFTSWQEVNDLLLKIAQEHDRDGYSGSYAKTKFQLTWDDGETYEGRLDVNTKEDTNIGQHILDIIKFYGGLWKPDHLTQEEYQVIIKDENPQEYADYLAKYDIEI